MICPAAILYENLYSYTHVTVFLLTLSCYCLLTFSHQKNIGSWILFWCTLTALVLLRSYFHFFWLLILFGISVIYILKARLPMGRFIITAVIPMLFVFAWLLKNWIVFDTFTSSSWLGMNMARVMPVHTDMGKVGPFKAISAYQHIKHNPKFPDVALLHQEYKSNTGFINFYHLDYISVAAQFKEDVLSEIKRHPLQYGQRVKDAFKIYFSPASHAPFIDANYRYIRPYAKFLNVDFTGYEKFRREHFSTMQSLPVFFLHLFLMIALFHCYRKHAFDESEKLLVTVMAFMLVYSLVVSNLLEYGENNRFRFEHVTIFLILLSKVLQVLWRQVGERKQA
jgi:hypothetical protein